MLSLKRQTKKRLELLYLRNVLGGEIHNSGDEVVLDDHTTNGSPICSLFTQQQTNGLQRQLDSRWGVPHGTDLN